MRGSAAWPWRPFAAVERPPVPARPELGGGRRSPRSMRSSTVAQASRGLHFRPEASKESLLRRVHLDSDRPGPHPGGARGLPRGCVRGRLRKPGRSPARRPAARRALGPPLDGHLAVQRLGRLERWQADPRQPAAHLAVARLDRRVARGRHRLRPDGDRHARRGRACPGRYLRPAGDRFPGPELQDAFPRTVARRHRQAHEPRVPRTHRRLRQVPRPQNRSAPTDRLLRAARDLRTASGQARSCPRARSIPRWTGWPAPSMPIPRCRRFSFRVATSGIRTKAIRSRRECRPVWAAR